MCVIFHLTLVLNSKKKKKQQSVATSFDAIANVRKIKIGWKNIHPLTGTTHTDPQYFPFSWTHRYFVCFFLRSFSLQLSSHILNCNSTGHIVFTVNNINSNQFFFFFNSIPFHFTSFLFVCISVSTTVWWPVAVSIIMYDVVSHLSCLSVC